MVPSTVDLARYRAVCRSWHRALRRRGPPKRQLPWILSFRASVPEWFQIHKVLVRSNPDDLVVLMTNIASYPVIFIRPGKDVWLPKPYSTIFTRIVEIAFLGDMVYGITQAEDLISLNVSFDSNGLPLVTNIKRIIQHQIGDDDSDVWSDVEDEEAANDDFNVWSDDEDDEARDDDSIVRSDDEDEEAANDDSNVWSNDHEDEEATSDENVNENEDDDMVLKEECDEADDNHALEEGRDKIKDVIKYVYDEEGSGHLCVIRYFVESCAKFLMVRRQLVI
uniref:F-box domain-containing protein n=1 Tax=Aegilops tauschii TaxID=37682 RepID=R7W2L8_AEGTA